MSIQESQKGTSVIAPSDISSLSVDVGKHRSMLEICEEAPESITLLFLLDELYGMPIEKNYRLEVMN